MSGFSGIHTDIYYTQKKYEEAVFLYDEVVFRFRAHNDETVLEQVVSSRFCAGKCLKKMKKHNQAISVWQDLVNLYGNSENIRIQESVCDSLMRIGYIYGDRKNYETTILFFNEIPRRFIDSEEIVIREYVADAMVGVGVLYGDIEKFEKSLQKFEEVIQHFGSDTDNSIIETVLQAKSYKADMLFRQMRLNEALSAYDDILTHKVLDDDWDKKIAAAMESRGLVLGVMKKNADSALNYHSLISRFKHSKDKEVAEFVKRAHMLKKVALGHLKKENEESYNTLIEIFKQKDPDDYLPSKNSFFH